jgi:hypothetical protein
MHIDNGAAIEGRDSDTHTHNDGTTGQDVYGARVAYDNGKAVSESRLGGEYPKFHK